MRPYLFVLACLAALLGSSPALAHPHVWITAKAEILYAPDGKVAGLRHAWTFDEAYSAYVTQGLDANKDGQLTPDELQELAKTNAESLLDFEYFTVLKANGAKQAFAAPREPAMAWENGRVTLRFDLPLKTPATAKTLALEVYDGTYFVDFRFVDGDEAARLSGAPKGCALTVTRPKPVEGAGQPLSESFFQALTSSSGYGALQATRVMVACP